MFKEDLLNNLMISNTPIKIDTPAGLEELIFTIGATQADVIIIDPLYKHHTRNEDSASEMAPLLSKLSELKKDKLIFVTHHQGKKHEKF